MTRQVFPWDSLPPTGAAPSWRPGPARRLWTGRKEGPLWRPGPARRLWTGRKGGPVEAWSSQEALDR